MIVTIATVVKVAAATAERAEERELAVAEARVADALNPAEVLPTKVVDVNMIARVELDVPALALNSVRMALAPVTGEVTPMLSTMPLLMTLPLQTKSSRSLRKLKWSLRSLKRRTTP
jgi:hypothetical protein